MNSLRFTDSDKMISFAAADNNSVYSAFIGLDMRYQIGTRFSILGNTEYSHSIDDGDDGA